MNPHKRIHTKQTKGHQGPEVEGMGSLMTTVSVWDEENALKTGICDGCTP